MGYRSYYLLATTVEGKMGAADSFITFLERSTTPLIAALAPPEEDPQTPGYPLARSPLPD